MSTKADNSGNQEVKGRFRWIPSIVLYGLMPLGALAIASAHLIQPALKIDAITLGLLVIAILPWLPRLLESAKLPGGWEVTFRRLETTVHDQGAQISDQKAQITSLQETINNLVKYSMSSSVFNHLAGIACMYEYRYANNEGFRREMYFLRDNGFIRPKSKPGFLDFDDSLNGHNLVDVAEPTEIGWDAIKLRKEEALTFLKEGKNGSIDLVDFANVRIDPTTGVPLKR